MEHSNEKLQPFSDADKKDALHCAYAQAVFILAQSILFPSLGIPGAMMVAICACMPWVTRLVKNDPTKAFGFIAASLFLSPFYSCFCAVLIELSGRWMGS